MSEKRTLMQIFDDWRILNCDPYPPRGRNERSEAFANLFSIMKKEGYTRSEIERKMLAPLISVSVSPTLKDKKLAKSLEASTEDCFRRGLSMAFIDDYDNTPEVTVPEYKPRVVPKPIVKQTYAPPDDSDYTPSLDGPLLFPDKKVIRYDEVGDSGFDFGRGGLFEELERELAEKEGSGE